MIFFYSRFGKTKIFAQALAEIFQKEIYELDCDLNKKNNFSFMFKALCLAFSGKSFPVSNMPQNIPDEIFLCAPIWGGQIVGAPKFFLENADLRNTTVNLLLTANVPVEKYKQNALELLKKIPCKPGEAYVFAASDKAAPEYETIKEHLRELICE
ncbi:MAG: hypothetical protein FWD19_03475 [Defluviitaleaceae bacterium]|nr:hypothetical protein [Defluviitaleaceae bacterium]